MSARPGMQETRNKCGDEAARSTRVSTRSVPSHERTPPHFTFLYAAHSILNAASQHRNKPPRRLTPL